MNWELAGLLENQLILNLHPPSLSFFFLFSYCSFPPPVVLSESMWLWTPLIHHLPSLQMPQFVKHWPQELTLITSISWPFPSDTRTCCKCSPSKDPGTPTTVATFTSTAKVHLRHCMLRNSIFRFSPLLRTVWNVQTQKNGFLALTAGTMSFFGCHQSWKIRSVSNTKLTNFQFFYKKLKEKNFHWD